MTITFGNDNDVIVHALKKIISYARQNQQIFVAQCIWWLASIIGLDKGLINHIDNLGIRSSVVLPMTTPLVSSSKASKEGETHRQDKALKECEQYLQDSQRLRHLTILKAAGRTRTGRINLLVSNKQSLKVTKKRNGQQYSKTEGIEQTLIQRRKAAGECLRCAWPSDRKGKHWVQDCVRKVKLDSGTPGGPAVLQITSASPESLDSFSDT
jgi:hypothetical protein